LIKLIRWISFSWCRWWNCATGECWSTE